MSFFDAGARELLELWALLDATARAQLIAAAKRLIECATFIGGPVDGRRVTDADREFPIHTFDHGTDRMAVYESDERGRFVFVDVRAADDVANEIEEPEPNEIRRCANPWFDDGKGGAR